MRNRRSGRKASKNSFLLDRFSEAELDRFEEWNDKLCKYHWDFYHELAYQRREIADKLSNSLARVCEPFTVRDWQRVVSAKWNHCPLSARGSLAFPGGRFNIGDLEDYKPFAALYLAVDRETALQEKYGASLEDALVKTESISMFCVSGMLSRVLDLTTAKALREFVRLTGSFSISKQLLKTAKELKIPDPGVVRTAGHLLQTLRAADWRGFPVQVGVPANPQIIGQIAFDAGIEGIRYRSVFTGHECLAAFPANLDEENSSYLEIEDAPRIEQARCDGTNSDLFI